MDQCELFSTEMCQSNNYRITNFQFFSYLSKLFQNFPPQRVVHPLVSIVRRGKTLSLCGVNSFIFFVLFLVEGSANLFGTYKYNITR